MGRWPSGRGVGVLLYDLLADDSTADFRAAALLEGLGLLGLSGPRGPARLPFGRGASGATGAFRGAAALEPPRGATDGSPGRALGRASSVCVLGVALPGDAGRRARPLAVLRVHAGRFAAGVLVPIRAFAGVRVLPFSGARVRAVGTAGARSILALQAEVAADAVLVLGGDVLIVVEARGVLDVILGLRDLYGLVRLVHPDDVHGDEGRLATEEAYLDADVLLAVRLVYKQVVYLADLVSPVVVDGVALVLVLEFPQPLLARHDTPPRNGCTYPCCVPAKAPIKHTLRRLPRLRAPAC